MELLIHAESDCVFCVTLQGWKFVVGKREDGWYLFCDWAEDDKGIRLVEGNPDWLGVLTDALLVIKTALTRFESIERNDKSLVP